MAGWVALDNNTSLYLRAIHEKYEVVGCLYYCFLIRSFGNVAILRSAGVTRTKEVKLECQKYMHRCARA